MRAWLRFVALGMVCLSFARVAAGAGPALFGADVSTNSLVKINPADASYVNVGSFGFNINGLAYAADMDQLFGLSAQTQRLYRIDRGTAGTTAVGGSAHPYGNANGLAYDSRRH